MIHLDRFQTLHLYPMNKRTRKSVDYQRTEQGIRIGRTYIEAMPNGCRIHYQDGTTRFINNNAIEP